MDKLDDGRHQTAPLGQAAHRLLKFLGMTAESQFEALEGPEEVRLEPATPEENLRIVSDMDTLLLSKDGLERYDHVADRPISQAKSYKFHMDYSISRRRDILNAKGN